jgi:DNA gyrase subunit B
MSTPKIKKLLSERAKKQWANQNYKNFMLKKFLDFYHRNPDYRERNNKLLAKAQEKYWSEEKNRASQAKRVSEFFKNHPEHKELLSRMALEQWQNPELKNWRARKTAAQWTESFRARRKLAYDRTYLAKALTALHAIYRTNGEIDIAEYNRLRRETNDKSLLRYETIAGRFFANNEEKLNEAVLHLNHRIKAIVPLKEKIAVYDLEVAGTHNFALSAGVFVHNSAKQGRDRKFQAILPLFGKVLNTERARIDQIITSDKFKSLIIAIGAGIADSFRLDKLRYHRIIIMADADVDGSHIMCLYLTFLYRHLRPLVEKGFVYVAMPPLYKIEWGRGEKKYVYSDTEKETLVNELGGNVKLAVQRYKGLGEMNAAELWETTLNPANRLLKQITVEDAARADRTFTTLMGEEVGPRKNFIQANAKTANLDI